MLPFLIGIIIILLTWLYIRWKKVTQYWTERGVPNETPHPFLGSLTFLMRENVTFWFRKKYNKYNTKDTRTPYIGIWYFWRPVLMIMSPELARNVLSMDSNNFRNKYISTGQSDTIGYNNLLILKDPLWTKIRRRISPVFTPAKINSLQNHIQIKCKELILRIESEQNNRIDLRSMLADLTTDIIGTSAFGVASNATITGESPLRAVTKEFMKFSVYRGISWACIFFWPELAKLFRFTFFPKATTDYFQKVFKIIVAQRNSNESITENKDLLDALLRMKKDGEKDFTDEVIIAQAAIFLQGGFDTTAVMLTYVFYEMAYNKGVQEKLYAELLDAKQNNGSEYLDSKKLSELTYLNCVIKEALRKYPAMGWMDRVAHQDYEIDKNLTIKAGTPVVVNTAGFHFDPEYFPEPDQFDPNRFLPENEKNIKPYTYLPFGEGPRMCIGLKYGLMAMRIAVTTVILKYKLDLYPDAPKPSDLKVEYRGLFTMPGEIVNIKFIPRV